MWNIPAISLLLWITVTDFVSIKSLPTKQTSPKTKIEVNSERKQAASHLFNTTVEEGKILDQQTSWRKITHRTNTEARDINKNIHGISVTQNNIVRRNSQENNINYNPYFVAEDDFQVLRSFHFSDVGHEDQQVSISKFVNINEGRTARLKCFTLNVPNVTVR